MMSGLTAEEQNELRRIASKLESRPQRSCVERMKKEIANDSRETK